MNLLKFYEICFKVGVLFTVVSFILGQFFDFMDFDGDFDLDGDIPGLAVSPLKPVIITAFITVFGGVGMMALNRGLSHITTLVMGISIAFIVAGLLYRFIIVPLHKAQNTSAVSQQKLVGHVAKVEISMEGASFGRIAYYVGGNTYTAPSKSEDGQPIKIGEKVVITAIKDHVYYVNRIETQEEEI